MLQSSKVFDRLTPSATRSLLEELGHFPVRKWGQNFLVDPNIVEKSLQLASIRPGDQVVEVGPGLGCLSAALLAAGCTVFAVEIDKRLANYLRVKFIGQPRFHLYEGDAVDFPDAAKPQGDYAWKVVANLPYAISTPWLEQVLRLTVLPESLTLMLQREAAQRMSAPVGSKHFSAVTLFLQALYAVGSEHAVARQCFYPVPGVDSQLLHLVKKTDAVAFSAAAREVMRALFTQRRKQIGALTRQMLEPEVRDAWLAALVSLGFSASARAETLPLECWRALDRVLLKN